MGLHQTALLSIDPRIKKVKRVVWCKEQLRVKEDFFNVVFTDECTIQMEHHVQPVRRRNSSNNLLPETCSICHGKPTDMVGYPCTKTLEGLDHEQLRNTYKGLCNFVIGITLIVCWIVAHTN